MQHTRWLWKWVAFTALAVFLLSLTPPAQAQTGPTWNFNADSLIHSVAVSADSSRVAMGTRNGTVYYLDHDGKELWTFDTGGTVFALALSADGQRVLAATESRKSFLLDGSGNLLWQNSHKFVIVSAAMSTAGDLIVLAPRSKIIWAFDGDGNQIWEHPFDTTPSSVGISPEGNRVAVGMRDANIYTFDRGGTLIWKTQLNGIVRGVALAAEGSFLAAADESKQAYLLSIENNQPNQRWAQALGDKGYSAAISTDGSRVAVASADQNVYLLDQAGTVQLKHQSAGKVTSVALSGDGSLLVYGAEDGKGGAFETASGSSGFAALQRRNLILSITIPSVLVLLLAGTVLYLSVHPSGKRWWGIHGRTTTHVARSVWRSRVSYLLLAPTFILLLVFNYYPAFSGLFHSFTKWSPGLSTKWIGLDNFAAIMNNTFFWSGMVNALILIVTGFMKLLMPLLVAELLFHLRSQTTQYWLRSLFIFPIVVPGVASILIWRNILDPNIGLLNNVLALFGLMNMAQPQAWLGDTRTAIWSIVFIGFPWIGAFALLIFYGGLISIPTELFDAAKVDGVNRLSRFWYLDLPMLMGQIKLLLILGFIGGMQEFTIVFLTTEGGPYNATYTPALELYYQAMRFNNFGLASAMGTFLFLIVLGGTILNLRMRTAHDTSV